MRTSQRRAGRGGERPGRSKPGRWPGRVRGSSTNASGGARQAGQRHVDEEDRGPAEGLGQHAAEQRAERQAAGAGRGPHDSARLRRGPRRTVMTSESVAGNSSAPPRPCSARARRSAPAPAPDRRPARRRRRQQPATNIRRRPRRSTARPPSSRKPPKATAYALTTHCRCGWRSRGRRRCPAARRRRCCSRAR